MKELKLKEIQSIEMDLLMEFDRICRSQKLDYSLGGGSLLGAVRHKGFIPWDDDIDVMMPRPDYDRFIEYCKNNRTSFKLLTYDTAHCYYSLFAKISDPSTAIVDDVMVIDPDLGVNIDVFPIDGLGHSMSEAIKIFNKTRIDREILNGALWKKYFRSKTHGLIMEPVRLAVFVISRVIDPVKMLKKIDAFNLQHPFESSAYAGCVCGSYREAEIMDQKTFTEYTDLEFEGVSLKAISNYDEYLRKHYGNYMELPPENKRKTHHTYTAYRK